MSLANPFAALWLAALVPVVVFYILKIRLRRVPVSTILFWRQIYDENQPRSIWQRLRHWLSLLAQLLLGLLLAGALTDPFFAWETRQLRRIVLILDNSASMNATDVSPSRLSEAKAEALRVIGGLRFRDELAVISAGGLPRVICGFSSHGRTLSHAIDDVEPTDNPTRVVEAIELARRLLGERQDEHHREIVVLTDSGYREGEAPAEPKEGSEIKLPLAAATPGAGEPPALRYHRFGTNTGNVGITRFQVRRSLADPLGYEILAEVTNASDEPIECRLEVDLNNDVVDVIPLKLTAGQHWQQTLEKTSAEGGTLLAKIDRADSLVADNQAWAVLPKRDVMPVTLVSEGNLFIQKVFESNPLVALTRAEPAGWKPLSIHVRQNMSAVAESNPDHGLATPTTPTVATPTLTVLHRHVPDVLPNGLLLVIDPRNSCDLWQLGEPIQNPIVSQQDKESPLLQHVRLDNVVMPEARQVKFTDEGVKVLARSVSGDPLLVVIERPGQKILLLTVNLDDSDLPLRTAFPILMMNALNWFTNNRGELREALPTGSITEIEVASLHPAGQASQPDSTAPQPPISPAAGASGEPGKAALLLVAPNGVRSMLPFQSERLSLGPFDQCGLWKIVAETKPTDSNVEQKNSDVTLLELACNIADRTESDIRVSTSDKIVSGESIGAGLFGNRPLWFWLIALAWLLMAVEWWAYQRRVIT